MVEFVDILKNAELNCAVRTKSLLRYCGICQVEVFHVKFIREKEKRPVVHCFECARKQSSSLEGFVCLDKYKLHKLIHVYDSNVNQSQRVPKLGAGRKVQGQQEDKDIVDKEVNHSEIPKELLPWGGGTKKPRTTYPSKGKKSCIEPTQVVQTLPVPICKIL